MKINPIRKLLTWYLIFGAAWLFLGILFSLISYPEKFNTHIINHTWKTIYIVVVNFIFFQYSLAYILKKRRTLIINIIHGIGLVFIYVMLVSVGLHGWVSLGIELNIFTQYRFSTLFPDGPIYRLVDAASYEARTGILSFIYFGIAKLAHYNFILTQAAQELRLEKKEAELNYLKSQTNPHFLFNTLNNIYSLARDKSDLAAESIVRLSEILRFMLYDTKGDFITIRKEIEMIGNYISLEKLRYDDSFRLDVSYEVDDMQQQLPPLLLIPLIENAFKHGASETSLNPFVEIDLTVNKQQLILNVKNAMEDQGNEWPRVENIGLSNLRRQLELLYSDYQLRADADKAIFTATLKINLASHVQHQMHRH